MGFGPTMLLPDVVADATRLTVIRHAESEWNAIGRWQGQADPPLSARGVRQAEAADPAPFDVVVSSPLVRARTTAQLLARARGIADVELESDLQERSAGEWTGLTRAEIGERWPGAPANGVRPSGYEPDADVWVRAQRAFLGIGDRHSGAGVLVVSHGGVIGAVISGLGGSEGSVRIPNLAGVILEHHRDGLTIVGRCRLAAEQASPVGALE
jgi:probable phosphoglycerate mutase